MTRAEEAALKYSCVLCDNDVKHCGLRKSPRYCKDCGQFIQGYEQAEKDLIERLVKFYPTLDYTFRSYMLQEFPELKGKIEHYD